jgi:polysaccharide biosynthesis transport protein
MNTPLLRADYPNDESQAEVGPEVTSNLPSLVELLRYRIGTIISVTVVTLIALAAIDWSIAPRYTAETLVLIDNRQDKVVNIESVLSGLPTDQPSILNQIQIIKSPTLAARVISKLHLDTDTEFNPRAGIVGQAISAIIRPLRAFFSDGGETQE